MVKIKHYMDIEQLREENIDLGGGMVRPCNCQGFEIGDFICVSEKFDGACASFQYDPEDNILVAFSRKQMLTPTNVLNGFYNFVQALPLNDFAIPNIVVFGEWAGARNKIVYEKENQKQWYVFDVFDKETEQYWEQEKVKEFCKQHGLKYIHQFYEGPFISWEHVKSFCHNPQYGQTQEGVVCKNQTKLKDPNNRAEMYLKVVNTDFKESKIKIPKEIDPEKEAEKTKAEKLIECIVTENRVGKMLLKLRDEGIIPNTLTPQDMKTVAKILPKRIYEDCVKEEPEIVNAAGEYGGKMISSRAMKIAKNIILGN